MLQDTSTSGLGPQCPETQDLTKVKEKVVTIYGGILIGKIVFRKVSSTQNPGWVDQNETQKVSRNNLSQPMLEIPELQLHLRKTCYSP